MSKLCNNVLLAYVFVFFEVNVGSPVDASTAAANLHFVIRRTIVSASRRSQKFFALTSTVDIISRFVELLTTQTQTVDSLTATHSYFIILIKMCFYKVVALHKSRKAKSLMKKCSYG